MDRVVRSSLVQDQRERIAAQHGGMARPKQEPRTTRMHGVQWPTLLVHDKDVGHACSSNFTKSLVSQVTFPSSLFTSGHLPTARDFAPHHPV